MRGSEGPCSAARTKFSTPRAGDLPLASRAARIGPEACHAEIFRPPLPDLSDGRRSANLGCTSRSSPRPGGFQPVAMTGGRNVRHSAIGISVQLLCATGSAAMAVARTGRAPGSNSGRGGPLSRRFRDPLRRRRRPRRRSRGRCCLRAAWRSGASIAVPRFRRCIILTAEPGCATRPVPTRSPSQSEKAERRTDRPSIARLGCRQSSRISVRLAIC